MAERKVWFITRPERDPRFHKEALLALRKATQDFTAKWTGNRQAHLEFERVLAEEGLKRDNISNDGSGGRTWAAMLRTFAYCYVNEDGYIVVTKVGEALLKGNKVHENIKKQILTLQIPNAYFLSSGFTPKFEKGFRIRPARFLVKLANQPELEHYVTKEEITFFALTAKTDDELPRVTEAILQFRHMTAEEKAATKARIAEQYDHRERSDKGARDFEKAHSDVAHTFMLIADYTGLAEYVRREALYVRPSNSQRVRREIDAFDERYPFNTRYIISLERMAENNGLDIDSYKATRFGGIGPATNRHKFQKLVAKCLADFPNMGELTQTELREALSSELPPKDAECVAMEVYRNPICALNPDFVEAYLYEEDNRGFEDKTGQIFKALGFDVEMRPKADSGQITEIEILLKYGHEYCGLIDAKNYRKNFPLSAALASHMAAEYIPNYEGYDGRKVAFFGYVTAHSFSGERNLGKISRLAKRYLADREIRGIMLSARVLLSFLDYCIDQNVPQHERVAMFLKAVNNKGYQSFEYMIRDLREGVM